MCVSKATGKAVPVPVCFAASTQACPGAPACGSGRVLVTKTPAGADGQAPCCPAYACEADKETLDKAAAAAGSEGGADKYKCPGRSCGAPPARCPAETRLERSPEDYSGCRLCPACVDVRNPRTIVAAPACWATAFACPPPPSCEAGYVPVITQLRGVDGAAPCCDTYRCRPGMDAHEVTQYITGYLPCPLSYSSMPTRCPPGTTRKAEHSAEGCAQKPACVDDATQKPVPTPVCHTAPVICPQKTCPDGLNAVLVTLRGAGGAMPCCDIYECVADAARVAAVAETQKRQMAVAATKDARVKLSVGHDLGKVPCGAMFCSNVPASCPAGFRVETPRDFKGCPQCATCVNVDTQQPIDPAKLPVCFSTQFLCVPPSCPAGQRPQVTKRKGDNGVRPCCDQFVCKSDPDPAADQQCPGRSCSQGAPTQVRRETSRDERRDGEREREREICKKRERERERDVMRERKKETEYSAQAIDTATGHRLQRQTQYGPLTMPHWYSKHSHCLETRLSLTHTKFHTHPHYHSSAPPLPRSSSPPLLRSSAPPLLRSSSPSVPPIRSSGCPWTMTAARPA